MAQPGPGTQPGRRPHRRRPQPGPRGPAPPQARPRGRSATTGGDAPATSGRGIAMWAKGRRVQRRSISFSSFPLSLGLRPAAAAPGWRGGANLNPRKKLGDVMEIRPKFPKHRLHDPKRRAELAIYRALEASTTPGVVPYTSRGSALSAAAWTSPSGSRASAASASRARVAITASGTRSVVPFHPIRPAGNRLSGPAGMGRQHGFPGPHRGEEG